MLSFILWVWICQLYSETIIFDDTTSGNTIIDCSDGSCVNDEIYYAGPDLKVTCTGTGNCNGLKVYCGTFDPPGTDYNSTNMDGGSVNCLVQNTGDTQNNIYFHCNGVNVAKCTFTHIQGAIISSTLECNVPNTAICEYSCPIICDGSNSLLCHYGSACGCITTPTACEDIIPTPVTGSPTTSLPTYQQTTSQTTTSLPTTSAPTTSVPTHVPITITPTTSLPTSSAPTTSVPTTSAPTTSVPTHVPTTNEPTTSQTTTMDPKPTTDFQSVTTTTVSTHINYNVSVQISIIANNITDTAIEQTFADLTHTYLAILNVDFNYSLIVYVLNNDNKLSVNIIIVSEDASIYDKLDEIKLIASVTDNLIQNKIEIIIDAVSTTIKPQTKHNNNNNNPLYIIIGAFLLIVCGIILFIIWYQRKKHYTNKQVSTINSEMELAQSSKNMSNKQSDSEDLYSDNGLHTVTAGNTKTDSEELYDNYVTTKNKGFYCRAIMDYNACDEDQLDVKENGIFYILEMVESGWWFGINENGNDGWIPSNYLKKCDLMEHEKLKIENKKQTDVGDLIGNKRENYLLNMDKYLNNMLPPKAVPNVVTKCSSSHDDVYSNESEYNDTVGHQTTIGS